MYKEPIIITCFPRSGSSLIAGIIEICGAFGGETRKGNKNNLKGYFENHKIIENIHKKILEYNGYDKMGQNPIPINKSLEINFNFKDAILEILINQGLKENQTWYIKDPKIVLLWKSYKEYFPKAKWIIVRRNKESVIKSILNTGFMHAYNGKKDWELYLEKLNFNIMALKKETNNIEIESEKISVLDMGEINKLIVFTELKLDIEKVNNFIDKNMFHY